MFDLRYYQKEAVDAVRAEWEKVQSTAIIAATATGKTQMYLSLATSVPGRVLVLVHRDYLIKQPIARLRDVGFDDVAVEKAEQKSECHLARAKIVFASVQSLSRPNRLATFDPMQFSAVITDEGHRALAVTYRRVLDHFRQNPRIRVLILTATPKRKDGIALGNICDSVAYTFGPKRASEEGWIVPLRFYRREVDGLDFSRVRLKGTDLDQEQVEKLLMEEEPLHKVCASLAGDRGPTLVFCPGVQIAQAYASIMNHRYRHDSAAVLWADSPDEEREVVTKKLANGDIEYVMNVDLFCEGYDVPELARVVWAAPTASLVRFTQGTGRVFRTHGSVAGLLDGDVGDSTRRRSLIDGSPKPFGQVVTYYPQNCKHQLCEPNDILGGDELPADVRSAAKLVQEVTAGHADGSDPEEDVQTAKDFLRFRELLDKRRREIKAVAAVTDVQYDAFGGSRNRLLAESANGARVASDHWPDGNAASGKQLGLLRHLGVKDPGSLDLTSWRASTMIDLIRVGIAPETAAGYGKRQALAVLRAVKERAGEPV